MIDKIFKELGLELIAFNTAKGSHYHQDLAQELSLSLLEMPRDKLIGLHQRDELRAYVYRMAFITYNKYNGNFYKKYRRRIEYIEEMGEEITLEDVLEDVYLTEIDLLWLQAYMDNDCKFVNVASEVGISRQCSSKRIKEILEKCRK